MPPIDQHPSPERLVAYHERRLSEEEAEEVRVHLVACRDCTAELLGLAELFDQDGGSEARAEISSEDLDAAWQRQRDRRAAPPVAPVVSLEERRARKAPRLWPWATAASLGLAASLAVVVIAQWRTIERLEQPRANPPLVNLLPVEAVRRGSREIGMLTFQKGDERAWVILNPDEEPSSSSYDVRITTVAGEPILGFEALPMSEAGNLRLEIPRAALSAGTFRILLFKGGQDRILEEFELEVRP